MNAAKQLNLFEANRGDKTGTVSEVMRYLIKKSGKTVQAISEESGIPATTLYSITQRNSNRMDILSLQTMANYFGVDLSIFCGLDDYVPARKLDEREMKLLDDYNMLTNAAKEKVEDYIADVAGNPVNKKKDT